MNQVNYLQTTGKGHCFICHEDYEDKDHCIRTKCFYGLSTPWKEECKRCQILKSEMNIPKDAQLRHLPHPPLKPQEEWEEKFDKKFGLFSNYADFCPSKETYKDFIKQLLSSSKDKWVEEMREKIETSRDWLFIAPHGLEKSENGEIVPRERKEEWYIKKSDILQLLPSHEDK